MAERKKRAISETEWEILQVLWSDRRATARQVADALQEQRGWTASTAKTLLDRMLKKGLVTARQVGNVWEYEPAMLPLDAQRSAWAEFVAKAFRGAAAPALQFLAKDAKLSRKDLAGLRALLDGKDGRK